MRSPRSTPRLLARAGAAAAGIAARLLVPATADAAPSAGADFDGDGYA